MNRGKRNQTTTTTITFHESKTFMDYLHGDVADGEAWLACHYEYFRESRVFWDAAQMRDEWIKGGQVCETVGTGAWEQFSMANGGLPRCGADFLCCASFPKKDWQELSMEERNEIMQYLPGDKIRPLHNPDVWSLKSRGILDRFKKMGEDAKPVIKRVPPGQKPKPMATVPAILQQHELLSLFHTIFTLDFSKSPGRLCDEFREWLRLPENLERLKKYKKPNTGATGGAVDRLKDLAAWRLYRELGNNWSAANNFANTRRKNNRPFHDARQDQSKNVQRSKADLGNEETYFLKAKKRALNYLAEFFPKEYGLSAPFGSDDFDKSYLEKLRKAVARPGKISKKSS